MTTTYTHTNLPDEFPTGSIIERRGRNATVVGHCEYRDGWGEPALGLIVRLHGVPAGDSVVVWNPEFVTVLDKP